MKTETRDYKAAWELRAAADQPAMLVGYASVFNSESLDLGGFREIVRPGAFADSLRANDVVAMIAHDARWTIGRLSAGTLRLSEDAKGLRAEIDLPDTTYARDLHISTKRGDFAGMSFGFRVQEESYEFRENGDVMRFLDKVEVFDVSVVAEPAYPETTLAARSLSDARAEHELKHLQLLQDGERSGKVWQHKLLTHP